MNTEPEKVVAGNSLATSTLPNIPVTQGNPLAQYFRQPAIYITLPSGGAFWPKGSIDLPESGELPVYPLTSRDEITLRTPDALLNGQGVVDVLQSCLPNIHDAWKMPAADADAILIGIRIATYGHSMDFEHTCPHCDESHSYGMDLRHLSESIRMPDYETPIQYGPLSIKFRPSSYADMTQVNKSQYEIQRQTAALDNIEDTMSEDAKNEVINNTINRLISLSQDVIAKSTISITITDTDQEITDQKFIKEFYTQTDAKTFNAIQKALLDRTKDSNVKPVPVNCSGCNEPITINIMFDYSSFFVVGS
jgi:hypothetical protein